MRSAALPPPKLLSVTGKESPDEDAAVDVPVSTGDISVPELVVLCTVCSWDKELGDSVRVAAGTVTVTVSETLSDEIPLPGVPSLVLGK